MNRLASLFSAAFVLLLARSPMWSATWPQWRGSHFDGISAERHVPTEWGEDKNIVWKLRMPGQGGSTPAIWNDSLFLTSQEGKEIVLLHVGADGKVRWKKAMGPATPKARGDEGNGASASPSTDGKHVYVFVSNGTLACFDFDGNEVWRFNAQDRYGKFNIAFGMHSTPVLYRDRLYLQLIHSGGAWVVALDKKTGADVWKVERKSDGVEECEHSYASPTLWQNDREAYLITHGNDYAIAHRLEDGGEIWRVGGLNPKKDYNKTLRFVASPCATADLIVIPSAKNGPVVGLNPGARGMVMPGNPYEYWRMPHHTPDVPSPLVHDGLVYLCREDGTLICLDARTGKEHYSHRTHAHPHRASPVFADGKIYLTARDGVVSVVKAGPEFSLLATNRLNDRISASPAIANGRIYLRGFDSLYAIGDKKD